MDVQVDEIKKLTIDACEVCKGTGYIQQYDCECRKAFLNKKCLLKYSNVPFKFLIQKGNYFLNMDEGGAQKVKTFLSQIKTSCLYGKSFYFYGNPGTGKTSMSVYILERMRDFFSRMETYNHEMTAYFISSVNLINAYFDDKKEFSSIIKYPLLVIDDFGKENIANSKTENAKSMLNTVYDQVFRTRNHDNSVTIMTSNETPKWIYANFNQSIKSLIGLSIVDDQIKETGNFSFCKFFGQDLRQTIK